MFELTISNKIFDKRFYIDLFENLLELLFSEYQYWHTDRINSILNNIKNADIITMLDSFTQLIFADNDEQDIPFKDKHVIMILKT